MQKREFEAFSDWDSVVAHVAAGLPIWYQAPLDRFPVRIDAAARARKRVRVTPPSNDCDPFTADRGHFDRFRRPSTAPYAAMLAESAKHAQPQRFETDLTTHDRAYLESSERAHLFGWILYDSGTHLAPAQIKRGLYDATTELSNPRYYLVVGYELRAVDGETFYAVLSAPRCPACKLPAGPESGDFQPLFACRCAGHAVKAG